jgi:hypothetical protein
MAVTVKNAVFWDDTPCGSCKNRNFRTISAHGLYNNDIPAESTGLVWILDPRSSHTVHCTRYLIYSDLI